MPQPRPPRSTRTLLRRPPSAAVRRFTAQDIDDALIERLVHTAARTRPAPRRPALALYRRPEPPTPNAPLCLFDELGSSPALRANAPDPRPGRMPPSLVVCSEYAFGHSESGPPHSAHPLSLRFKTSCSPPMPPGSGPHHPLESPPRKRPSSSSASPTPWPSTPSSPSAGPTAATAAPPAPRRSHSRRFRTDPRPDPP